MVEFVRPQIMGILNVTPDSFSDGGQYDSYDLAVKQALSLLDQGADIIDIGGESTRPGAVEIDVKEEVRRTVPVIMALREATLGHAAPPVISIDTRKPDVAEAAILAGADIWNDVSGLTFDPRSESVAAELDCPLILMHSQGSPEDMQDNPHYAHAVKEIRDWLAKRLDACEFAGFIGRIDGSTADDRLGGSIASALWSAAKGADILRVHDVSETVQDGNN